MPQTGNRAVLANNRPTPTHERPLYDIAGRFHDFQTGPKIPRPNLAGEMIPVIGPAWDAVADIQDGNYGSAAFNAAMAAVDLLPIGYGIKAVRNASKVTRALGTRTPTAKAAQAMIHKLGLASPEERVHHVIPLNGLPRNIPLIRNNPLFLKPLAEATHKRLRGRSGDLKKFGPVARVYHGTTDWMKAGAAGLTGYGADTGENVSIRPSARKAPPPRSPRPGGIFPTPHFTPLP